MKKTLRRVLSILCYFLLLFPASSLCSDSQAERTKSRLPVGRFVELLLGCVPLGFVRKARLKTRTDLHQGRADGDPGGALR